MDELPQLLNVLTGRMSLVGPRPEVPKFASHYTERQRKVLDVRPGMTGPSVIVREEELLASHVDKEGFYVSTVMPAKLEIDLVYCEEVSLRTDLQIVYRTFVTLLTKVDGPFKRFPHLMNRPTKARASWSERKKDEVST
jgi:lipopolysaccharide/colanic/teichoic acid biosynthesis glycosyltransferase